MALAPESREGFWDLGGDPHAHPPWGKAGSGPSDSGGHFDPKIFAQLFQENKGENGLRNEANSSRNKALERDSKKGESQCAPGTGCPSSPTLAAAQVGRHGSALTVGCGAAVSHHGHHSTQGTAPCANPSAPHIGASTCTAVPEFHGCNRATAVLPGPRLSPIEARAYNTSGPSLGRADKGLMQEAAGLTQQSWKVPCPRTVLDHNL